MVIGIDYLESKEAVSKVLFWRIIISIPLTTIVTYLYYGQIFKAIAFVILMNIIMTIAHFGFEKVWPKIWSKYE